MIDCVSSGASAREPTGGILPRTSIALLNAHVTVGRSDSMPDRLAQPSAASSSRRRPGAHPSGCSHPRGYTCPIWDAEAARASQLWSSQHLSKRTARPRHRAWPQFSAKTRAREPRWISPRQRAASTRATARGSLAVAGGALQFEGAVTRLGARATLAGPAMLRCRMHGPPRRAQFAGNVRCLGRRRGRARRRLGGRRGTLRRPRAVGSSGISTTSPRPQRIGPVSGPPRATSSLVSRRRNAWLPYAAG